jgi:hypothetical protein
MADLSLALNTDMARLATATGYTVNGEMDMCFVISQCTSFKLQGSFDGGSTYNDLAGTSTLLGTSGTLTASAAYLLSLVRCRCTHIKPVFSGTNPSVVLMRHWTRQAPKVSLDKTLQRTIVDPIAGTA